jgi:hypothetical protein
MRGHGEQRAVAEQDGVHPARHRRGDDERDEGAGRELEQQQLDGKYDSRQRRPEGGGHAGRGPGCQQDLAFAGGNVDDLADQRAEGAARDDDGPLGTERATGADGNGRRDGLGDGGSW